jgi:hypothetical protein
MVRTHSQGGKSPSDETVQTVQKGLQETSCNNNYRKNRIGKGCDRRKIRLIQGNAKCRRLKNIALLGFCLDWTS